MVWSPPRAPRRSPLHQAPRWSSQPHFCRLNVARKKKVCQTGGQGSILIPFQQAEVFVSKKGLLLACLFSYLYVPQMKPNLMPNLILVLEIFPVGFLICDSILHLKIDNMKMYRLKYVHFWQYPRLYMNPKLNCLKLLLNAGIT